MSANTSTRVTVKSLAAEVASLSTSVQALADISAANQQMLTALLADRMPAQVVTSPAPEAPKAEAKACTCTPEKRCSVCFVQWVRDTAEAREARKTSNKAMAAWLREKNLPTNGPVWEAAKAGERKVTVLRKLAKAQA